ncbi:hypothetical protein FVE85_0008 [Porphyridium purpureum]|uniref:BspA family leucine-rich repeat surface protein n=1 Tax=Porphyridium purpureum TaxID=35688 RepID=A0A5J4YXG8_PORPP|nr:hypothetical protein FVE85_0008 [Porphyridium purpureum]|eukprot:POR2538..scf208_2
MTLMFPLAWSLALTIALLARLSLYYNVVAREICRVVELSDPCSVEGTLGLVPDAEGPVACTSISATCLSGFPDYALQPCLKYVESDESQEKMVLEYDDVSEVSLDFSASPVDVVVDNGDGTAATYGSMGTFVHAYKSQGEHAVVITGSLGGIRFMDGIARVASSGKLGLTTLDAAFFEVRSLQSLPANIPRSVTDLSCMFAGSNFNGEIGSWDVSRVANMGSMFCGAASFNQEISGWDVSSVTDMRSMFQKASSFNQEISGWDVSSVTDMRSMFQKASSFDQDISGWNISSVTDMSYMFYWAVHFNQDISGWDVSNVTDMSAMFYNAASFNQDIFGWDVSRVTNMGLLFSVAESFNQDLAAWDVRNVVNCDYFNNYSALACSFSNNCATLTCA